jgi:hypothetical protein
MFLRTNLLYGVQLYNYRLKYFLFRNDNSLTTIYRLVWWQIINRKIRVFWDSTPYIYIAIYVPTHKSTRRNICEDSSTALRTSDNDYKHVLCSFVLYVKIWTCLAGKLQRIACVLRLYKVFLLCLPNKCTKYLLTLWMCNIYMYNRLHSIGL